MDLIKQELVKMNMQSLNEIAAYITRLTTVKARTSLTVGQSVWVVQKTKKTAGVVKKINKTRCLVDMSGTTYNVPMSMLVAKNNSESV
jgi:FKBP-type peptidyl-prolyl cis-trans isomerase 2